MVNGLWGKKVGMTQVFSVENKVVPVTVIDVSNWYVTQIKTQKTDGYSAVKLGCVKNKFAHLPFSNDWLSEPRKHFSAFKEVPLAESEENEEPTAGIEVGHAADPSVLIGPGDTVDVFGVTKGAGFQGVVKRHGFAGGKASHGSTFGRHTGGLSFMRSRGRVIKGKRMPGHMGTDRRCMRNLEVIKVEQDARVVLVKGSVPGKSGSLVFVRKCR